MKPAARRLLFRRAARLYPVLALALTAACTSGSAVPRTREADTRSELRGNVRDMRVRIHEYLENVNKGIRDIETGLNKNRDLLKKTSNHEETSGPHLREEQEVLDRLQEIKMQVERKRKEIEALRTTLDSLAAAPTPHPAKRLKKINRVADEIVALGNDIAGLTDVFNRVLERIR